MRYLWRDHKTEQRRDRTKQSSNRVTVGQEMPPKISRMIINYGEPRCKGWGSLTVTAGKKILQGRMSEWEIRVWFWFKGVRIPNRSSKTFLGDAALGRFLVKMGFMWATLVITMPAVILSAIAAAMAVTSNCVTSIFVACFISSMSRFNDSAVIWCYWQVFSM